jgi:hypothetical protein
MSTFEEKPDFGGGRATSNIASKSNLTGQQARVLEALCQQPMSAAELQWELRIAHAPAAIRYLRRRGFCIALEQHPHPCRPGKWIKRYRLAGEG